MARPREFSVEEALDRAMHLFWAGGYHATSTRQIEDRLELGRQSIYNAFGDKLALYRSAVERYESTILAERRSCLTGSAASRQAIVRYLAGLVERLTEDSERRGCFACNALLEMGPGEATIVDAFNTHREQTEELLTRAIEKGLLDGSIASCPDPRTVARALTAVEIGMCVAARARLSRTTLVDMASAALRPLY